MADVAKVADVPIDLDLISRTTDKRDFGDANTKSLVDGSSMWAITHPGKYGAYTEDVVEKTAWPVRDNPRPRYPDELQRAGIEGNVVVQFVVDTLGRAELGELQVIETPHPLFVDAVRSALARYRFSVGEAGGRRVRTRVQIPFDFRLAR